MTPLEILPILLVCEAIAIVISVAILITLVVLECRDMYGYVMEKYFPRFWYYD